MPCKHLLHYSHGKHTWSVASCSAKNTPYVPSLYELERFCQSGRHLACPAYLCFCEAGCGATESRIPVGINSRQVNLQKSA
jgi:hypothetical protein